MAIGKSLDDDPATFFGGKLSRPPSVAQALDELTLGWFHLVHLLRMMLAWAIFASTQECTPYMFQGLRHHLQAEESEIATFAAGFPLGCGFGALAASPLLDKLGRRGTLLLVCPVAVLLSMMAASASSVLVLTWIRTAQAFAFSIAITGMSAWYIELLPTNTRGMLMAAYSVGYPIGRAGVIFLASMAKDQWRSFMVLIAWGYSALFLTLFLSHESPRYLAANGRAPEANAVLKQMYEYNGQGPWEHQKVCLHMDIQPETSSKFREIWLVRSNRELMLFSLMLFAVLSSTTVLLDTWGPLMYHRLLSPDALELPHQILMLFNLGDLGGVVLSILIVDRIGRFGSFVIGFFLQGSLLLALTSLDASQESQLLIAVICGTLSSGCRCFAWESAQMWTLEAFPTEIRALAFSSSMAFMRFSSIVSLKVSAEYIEYLSAATALRVLAVMLLAGGFSTCMLPKETANLPMTEGAANSGKSF